MTLLEQTDWTPCGPFQPDPFCGNAYLHKSGQPACTRSSPTNERPSERKEGPAAGAAAQPPPVAVASAKSRPFVAAPAAGRGGAGAAPGRPLELRGGADRRGAAGVGAAAVLPGGPAAGDRMVFESLVVDVLNRFLGDYVVNVDSSQLKLGIWGGTGLARRGGAACLPFMPPRAFLLGRARPVARSREEARAVSSGRCRAEPGRAEPAHPKTPPPLHLRGRLKIAAGAVRRAGWGGGVRGAAGCGSGRRWSGRSCRTGAGETGRSAGGA